MIIIFLILIIIGFFTWQYGQVLKEITENNFIKVIYPNGGEILRAGEIYDIKWKAKGVNYVDIYISDPYTMMCGLIDENGNWKGAQYTICSQTCNEEVIVKNVPASAEKYSWTIPTDQAGSDFISVKSSVGEINCLSDENDNSFSIVK